MIKYRLPHNKYFFSSRRRIIYFFTKNLKILAKQDHFGYFILTHAIHKKKLKLIKILFSFNTVKLNPYKNYAIFLNYNFKSHLIFSEKIKIKKEILFFENPIDNGIYIFEII
jgi:hypothetical protein